MTALVTLAALTAQTAAPQLEWTFDTPADARAWVANSHLANVKHADGILSADAVEWDPFFVCKGLSIPASPWQFVLLRVKADKPGQGQLFWSGVTEGKYDGFSPRKTTHFTLRGTGDWEDVVIVPGWHPEGTIRQLRLDLYDDARFDIDAIRIMPWPDASKPLTDTMSWTIGPDPKAWRIHPAAHVLLSPPLRLAVDDKPWVTLVVRSEQPTAGRVLWLASGVRDVQSQPFAARGGGQTQHINVDVGGLANWRSPLLAIGVDLPSDAKITVESLAIADQPSGPPELTLNYVGLEDAINRAGRPCRLLAQFANLGGSATEHVRVRLDLPSGVKLVEGKPVVDLPATDYDDQRSLTWLLQADQPGTYAAKLSSSGKGAAPPATAELRILPAVDLPKAEYVPPPKPVETVMDICAYYFPGWQADAKWDCIRRVAPIRKPLLGYYDESNPECVDWQIKWAVENGITCFLVDWYWIKGRKSLEHWFDAYRKARYRDHLQVAIMWANHIPPGSHSMNDWENVTREWIDRYFTLPTYYHIDGWPAVFLWSPHNIRRDLGGSDAVAKAFAMSQDMARKAGHKGIRFLAMFGHESKSGVEALIKEGYYGATNYHEWGDAPDRVADRRRNQYQHIVETVRKTWEEKVARCGELVYYPVVDTGWDSRPWHGDKARVILGRTPERFENILRQAKDYCRQLGRQFVVLGPVNEWGEGSYIMPNTEFGFRMLEAIRRVYAKGDPSTWPQNIAPTDVGLGPYDYPHEPGKIRWTFQSGPEGWADMMGVGNMQVRDGKLCFETVTHDPAIMARPGRIDARKLTRLVVRMRIDGTLPAGTKAQMFYSVSSRAMTEATSFRFPLKTDGEMHTYTVDLSDVHRWRGRVTTLRFDPCNVRGVNVCIDEIRFE